jgi:hypothetical protein
MKLAFVAFAFIHLFQGAFSLRYSLDVFGTSVNNVTSNNIPTIFGRDQYGGLAELRFRNQSLGTFWQGDEIIVNSGRTLRRRLMANNNLDTVNVDDYTILPRSSTHQESVLSSVAFIIQIQGIPLGITLADLEGKWYGDGETMENYFRTCSYGKTSFSKANNIIVDMSDSALPSTGRTLVSNVKYDFTNNCGFAELYAMMEWAEVNFAKYDNRSLPNYQRRILFAPNLCRWYGVGTYGCNGPWCGIWVRENRWDYLNTLFHEFGHTMYAVHSSVKDGWEYGDCSCTMGCASRPTCFNSPQSVRQGWSTTVAEHDAENTVVGKWYRYTISSLEKSERNTVVIYPDWVLDRSLPAVYLSMRSSDTLFTKSIEPKYLDNLAVHTSPYGVDDIFRTDIEPFYGLHVGESHQYSDSNITIKVEGINGNNAVTFSFCRHSQAFETNCSNDADDDCNGLADSDDPNCRNQSEMTPSPPAAPPPRPQTPLVDACGDGICGYGETTVSCPKDCRGFCGDALCNQYFGETTATCLVDCPGYCGDGLCNEHFDESAIRCPMDCPGICGDGYCNRFHGESTVSCPIDCHGYCGDGYCNELRETPVNCPIDCPGICGDGVCNQLSGEDAISCPMDCGM